MRSKFFFIKNLIFKNSSINLFLIVIKKKILEKLKLIKGYSWANYSFLNNIFKKQD